VEGRRCAINGGGGQLGGAVSEGEGEGAAHVGGGGALKREWGRWTGAGRPRRRRRGAGGAAMVGGGRPAGG
jgi:hypothetical protein